MAGEPNPHHRRTEWQMVLGGFALIFLIGGGLLWFLYGQTVAAVGLVVLLVAAGLWVFLSLLLRALDTWARSGD